jgi:uncharacterized membrane protein YgcG
VSGVRTNRDLPTPDTGPHPKDGHPTPNAFTLFELILAIALSVTLVSLIGTAINLYLTRVDNSRTQVEEAQLARTILAMIADDLRAATIYQPQDTSAIQQLMSSGTPFDVDSIDQPGSGSGGAGSVGSTGTTSSAGTTGSASSMGSGLGGSSSGSASVETGTTLPLGLNGTISELYVDATRLPRREELFATATGYTNAPIGVPTGSLGASASSAEAAGITPPTDLKSIRYFIRPGDPVDAGSVALTSLSPAAQLAAGGLVRQEVPRSLRLWAEQSGNTAILDSGQALLAPEVAHIEFTYFDGAQLVEYWDMRERNTLPVAVLVRLWIAPADASGTRDVGQYTAASLANNAREYRQTVYLPMSQVGGSGAAGGMSGTGGSSSGFGTSSGSGSSSGSSSSGGSGFGQQ